MSNLAPLAGLRALRSIDCSRTLVSDLAPLAGLRTLGSIDCSKTPITDLAPLAEIRTLPRITARGLMLAASSTRYLDLPQLKEF